MTHFAWHSDNKPYVIDGDDDKIVIRDGYSQWLLGPGADFSLSRELKADANDPDYNLITIIRDLNHPEELQTVADEALPAGIQRMGSHLQFGSRNRFSQRARPFDFQQSERNDRPHRLVTPVPVRLASVPNQYDEDNQAPFVPPENLDVENTVIIGVMDDSINIVHERFTCKNADGFPCSRIDYAWIQDAISPEISSVPHGMEITREVIDQARLANPNASETELLKELQVMDHAQDSYQPEPLGHAKSHGTFVTDLAGGFAPTDVEACNTRIISVKLPVLSSQDTSGATLIAAIISGSHYIFDRARQMSETVGVALPVVLNFSYGFFGGPHNGRHLIERALAEQAKTYREAVAELVGGAHVPVEIALPAGNSHLSQTHAATAIATADDQLLELPLNLMAQPEDRTSSFVELWLPNGAVDVGLTITTPLGGSETFALGDLKKPFGRVLAKGEENAPDRETIIARLKLDRPNGRPDKGHKWRLLLALAPTKILDQARPPAPHGKWQIELTAKVPADARLESWIQRDVSVSGLGARARQAYFEDLNYVDQLFDPFSDLKIFDSDGSLIKRDGTLSGIATVATNDEKIGVTVVGSYYYSNKTATAYSSAGSDTIVNPDVLAPTDTSRLLAGVLAAGTLTGSVYAFNGTSAAAPQLARILADAIRRLTPTERDQYNRQMVLQNALDGLPVERPDQNHPEYLTNKRIRLERTEIGRLALPDQLKTNIERGTYVS